MYTYERVAQQWGPYRRGGESRCRRWPTPALRPFNRPHHINTRHSTVLYPTVVVHPRPCDSRRINAHRTHCIKRSPHRWVNEHGTRMFPKAPQLTVTPRNMGFCVGCARIVWPNPCFRTANSAKCCGFSQQILLARSTFLLQRPQEIMARAISA